MRLAALNREAAECGLKIGTSLADARAIIPELEVHEYQPQADAELLDRIADDCMRFTPMVAAEQPDGIICDITGSAHIFGGEAELLWEVQSWLASMKIEARHAVGCSSEAAHALARYHHGAVGDVGGEMAAIRALPIAALELEAEADLGLRRAGLKTIGDVIDRPREVIAARFGAMTVYRLERLIGAQSKPIALRKPPPDRTYRRHFAEPITSTSYALNVLGALLDEANASLAEEELGGRAFEARFCRVDGAVQCLHIETGMPTRDSQAILRLFEERLGGLADPLDPGFGFDSVELSVPHSESLRPQQEKFDQKTHSEKRLTETLDVLGTRLGRNGVLRFCAQDTHIPENTQIAVPASAASRLPRWPHRTQAGAPPMRPLHLFDPPHRISVIAEVPDGPPRRFRWRGKLRDAVRYEGPERIAAEWWKSAGDPLGYDQLTRDYYRIEDADGRRYWIFRHGLHGREADNPDWYLHGLFA